MRRVHFVIMLVVLLVLALFAMRVSDHTAPVPPANKAEQPRSGAVAPLPPGDTPPSGSVQREDPGIGTTQLLRGAGSAERP